MDDIVVWIQAKIGPMTFGAILGFVLQVVVFRPANWVLALERAIAAVVAPILFAKPLLPFAEKLLPGIDRDTGVTLVAGLVALGGIELLRAARAKLLKQAGGGKDE